jgi:hypothetical protein
MGKILALVGALAVLVPIKCFANNFYLYATASHQSVPSHFPNIHTYFSTALDDAGNAWGCEVVATQQSVTDPVVITGSYCTKTDMSTPTNAGSGPPSIAATPSFRSSVAGFWRINTQTGDVHFCLVNGAKYACTDIKLP